MECENTETELYSLINQGGIITNLHNKIFIKSLGSSHRRVLLSCLTITFFSHHLFKGIIGIMVHFTFYQTQMALDDKSRTQSKLILQQLYILLSDQKINTLYFPPVLGQDGMGLA